MHKKWIVVICVVLILSTGVLVYAQNDEEIIAPTAIYELEDGGFLFTDAFQNAIWLYEENGSYTKLAGDSEQVDANGMPMGGSQDGVAQSASFGYLWDITEFLEGYAITDTDNHRVRFFDWENETVATLGGDEEGYDNGVAGEVSFSRPTGIITLENGNLLVADTGNHIIREITTEGEVSLYAGRPNQAGDTEGSLEQAQFNEPTGLHYEDGTLYVVDSGNHRICKIQDGTVTTFAGVTGQEGYANGVTEEAQFSWPTNAVEHEGVLYVADSGNGVIRAIENGEVTTFLETGAIHDGFAPVDPRAVAVIDEELWVGDVFAHDLFAVELT